MPVDDLTFHRIIFSGKSESPSQSNHNNNKLHEMNVSSSSGASQGMEQPPVLKLVNRTWKTLPDTGDDVYIRDPKLKEGYVGDLSKKSVAQLQEIIERQDRILNNK